MSTGLGIQFAEPTPVDKQTGPIAVCCGKPFRECKCPPPSEDSVNARLLAIPDSPAHRQAKALEMIAANLAILIKHLCPEATMTASRSEPNLSAVLEAKRAEAEAAKKR